MSGIELPLYLSSNCVFVYLFVCVCVRIKCARARPMNVNNHSISSKKYHWILFIFSIWRSHTQTPRIETCMLYAQTCAAYYFQFAAFKRNTKTVRSLVLLIRKIFPCLRFANENIPKLINVIEIMQNNVRHSVFLFTRGNFSGKLYAMLDWYNIRLHLIGAQFVPK